MSIYRMLLVRDPIHSFALCVCVSFFLCLSFFLSFFVCRLATIMDWQEYTWFKAHKLMNKAVHAMNGNSGQFPCKFNHDVAVV